MGGPDGVHLQARPAGHGGPPAAVHRPEHVYELDVCVGVLLLRHHALQHVDLHGLLGHGGARVNWGDWMWGAQGGSRRGNANSRTCSDTREPHWCATSRIATRSCVELGSAADDTPAAAPAPPFFCTARLASVPARPVAEEPLAAVASSVCAATRASRSIAPRVSSTVCFTVVSIAKRTISGSDSRLKNTCAAESGGERRRGEEKGGEGRRGEESGGERRRAAESGGERRRAEESEGAEGRVS